MIVKICSSCKKELEIETNFYSNGYQTNGNKKYKAQCKKCAESIKKDRFLQLVVGYYKKYECTICGYDKCTNALEFHHRDPSVKEVGIANMKSYSTSRLLKEFEKCDILCSNCHREVHAGMHKEYLLT